jgi:hypothetical protein
MCFYLLFSFYIMFIFPNLLFFLPVLEDYMFSNYLQYLLDYPSTSDDDDSDWLLDDAGSAGVEKVSDHIVDSDLLVEESDSDSSSDGHVQEDRTQYSHRLLMYHHEAFYDAYIPEWEKVCKSTHLINQEKYDEIVALLRTERQPKEPPHCHKYRSTYALFSNVASRCLYRLCDKSKTYKAVPTVETVFDVILEAHSKGGHAKGTYNYCFSALRLSVFFAN